MENEKDMIETKELFKEWKAKAIESLRGMPFESLNSNTYEGILVKPLYTREDSTNRQPLTKKDAVNSNDWKISQWLSGDDAKSINKEIKHAKNRGQNSFYLTTFTFLKAREDFSYAFQNIDWRSDTFYFDVGEDLGVLPLILEETRNRCEQQQIGTIGFDPFEEILLKGKNSRSLQKQYDFLADMMKSNEKHNSEIRCLIIKGGLYHEAGGSSLQELIYTFSQALDIVNELLNRGVSINCIARYTTVSFAIGSNFFMELAKFRAARLIWASIIHALGGNKDAQKLYLHAITSDFNKTNSDVHVNLLRTTTEGFSAAAAGVNELTISPFNSFRAEGDFLGKRIARNSQLILKEESLIARVIDPAAGSYYIESLTDELAEKAWKTIQEIDKKDGFLQLLKEGTPQKELASLLERKLNDVNMRKSILVGINAFVSPTEHIKLKKQVNNHRDAKIQVSSFQKALQVVKENNTVPIVILKNGVEQIGIQPIRQQRLAEHFEKLRMNSGEYHKRTGQEPKVGVIVYGKRNDYKPRLDFVSSLLAIGGIGLEVVHYHDREPFSSVNSVILCGKNDDYHLIDATLIREICAKGQVHLMIVEGYKKDEKKFRELGVTSSLTTTMNAYEFLKKLQHIMGV